MSEADRVEPVFCHAPETLKLVRVVRLLDELLRRSPGAERERLGREVRRWAEEGRDLAVKISSS
jgi:hypothetical protein